MSVHCRRCGQTWPRDPALDVRCPTCRAPIGSPCQRPSGHAAPDVHAARDRLALATVPGYSHCPAAVTTDPTTPPDESAADAVVQITLF